MQFQGKYKKGGFDFGNNRERILKHCDFNVGKRFILSDFLPESAKQRRFYHGAVITLWVYLDGKDYKDSDILDSYHELAKIEFNAEIVITNGKKVRIGKSSKGKLNDGFVEKVIDNLEENYGIERSKCLDPKLYKDFMEKIYMNGDYDTFIDYLIDLKLVPVINR